MAVYGKWHGDGEGRVEGGARDFPVVAEQLILHVLPVDLARGAQTYARELRQRLDGEHARHRTLTIFHSDGGTLEPDYRLEVPNGLLRRVGADVRAAWRLRQLCRRLDPTTVVAHGGESLKYAVFARTPRARLVYYKIGVGSTRLRGPRLWLHRALCRRAGTVAAVSEDCAREARTIGVEPGRLRVIPNGRDVLRYGSHPRTPTSGPVRLCFVGHLTASKRPELFVAVVRSLRTAGLAVEGVVAGDGPLREAVLRAAEGLPVTCLGAVDDVPLVLSGCDIFVFTSVAAGEGMPGVLIEAGLASLPVVTTAVPGAADVIENGTTGFIVDVDDSAGMIDAVRRLVDDPERREQMGAAARRRCEERFNMESSVGKWRVLLDELIVGVCTSST